MREDDGAALPHRALRKGLVSITETPRSEAGPPSPAAARIPGRGDEEAARGDARPTCDSIGTRRYGWGERPREPEHGDPCDDAAGAELIEFRSMHESGTLGP